MCQPGYFPLAVLPAKYSATCQPRTKSTDILVKAASIIHCARSSVETSWAALYAAHTCCNLLLPPAQYVTFMTVAITRAHAHTRKTRHTLWCEYLTLFGCHSCFLPFVPSACAGHSAGSKWSMQPAETVARVRDSWDECNMLLWEHSGKLGVGNVVYWKEFNVAVHLNHLPTSRNNVLFSTSFK